MKYIVRFYIEDYRRSSLWDYVELGFECKRKYSLSPYKKHRLFRETFNKEDDLHSEYQERLNSKLKEFNNMSQKEIVEMIKKIIIEKEITKTFDKSEEEIYQDNLIKELKGKFNNKFEIEIKG